MKQGESYSIAYNAHRTSEYVISNVSLCLFIKNDVQYITNQEVMNIFMSISVIFEHSPDANAADNKAFVDFITQRFAAIEGGSEFLTTILNQGPITIHIEAKNSPQGARGFNAKWNHKKREVRVGIENYPAFIASSSELLNNFLFMQIIDALSIAVAPELSPENIPNILRYPSLDAFLIDMSKKEYNSYYTRTLMHDMHHRYLRTLRGDTNNNSRSAQNSAPLLSQTITYEQYFQEVFLVAPYNHMLSLSDYYINIYNNNINKHKLSIQQWLNTINHPQDNLERIVTRIDTSPLTEQDKRELYKKAHIISVAADNLYGMTVEMQRIGSPEIQAFYNVNEFRSIALNVKERAQSVMSFLEPKTNPRQLSVGRSSLLPAVTREPAPTLPSVAASAIAQPASLTPINPYLFFESNVVETVEVRPPLAAGQVSSETPILSTRDINIPYSL